LWSAQRLDWNSLSGIPETSRAKVMKDPEAERGKRLCASGTIIEIHSSRRSGQTIFSGGINTPSFDVVRFYAVRSTGDLVQRSVARICGVVTGTETYSNSSGGVTHAVFVVGMFDLPENRQVATTSATGGPSSAASPKKAASNSGQGSVAACCADLERNAATAPEPNASYLKQAANFCKTQGSGNPATISILAGMLRGAGMPASCR